jgi:hypothetical protein
MGLVRNPVRKPERTPASVAVRSTAERESMTSVVPVPGTGEDDQYDALIEQALDAFQAGDVDRLDAVGARLRGRQEGSTQATAEPGPAAGSTPGTVPSRASPLPAAARPNTLTIAEGSVGRAKSHSAGLLAMGPNAAPDERVLTDLVVAELPLAFELRRLELELAARIGLALDNPGLLVALARAMRELTALSGSVTRRIQGSLGVAANLRAQRRLITGRGSLDDV